MDGALDFRCRFLVKWVGSTTLSWGRFLFLRARMIGCGAANRRCGTSKLQDWIKSWEPTSVRKSRGWHAVSLCPPSSYNSVCIIHCGQELCLNWWGQFSYEAFFWWGSIYFPIFSLDGEAVPCSSCWVRCLQRVDPQERLGGMSVEPGFILVVMSLEYICQ